MNLSTFVGTQEQLPVIEAPPEKRLYVEAGPGTGKTDTLVARLRHLLGEGGLNPSEILVLSFSVAAVKELKTRIVRIGRVESSALTFVDIRTFDSFASRFLRLFVDGSMLTGLSYDQRILRATEELKAQDTAREAAAGYKHILLDEMQDLVGVRADFAFELLRSAKSGFTLFGDSAQGIYDFTIEKGTGGTTAEELLKSIRKEFPDLDTKYCFTRNFRVGGNGHLESIAMHGRTLLLESPEKARAFLEEEFGKLGSQGSTGQPSIHSGLLNESTCVVCRTNGQVLRLAGELHNKGIPFEIAREKNEVTAPAWLACVFISWADPTVRRKDFLAKTADVLGLSNEQGLLLWNGLISALGKRKEVSFNINDLRAAITDGAVIPDDPLRERRSKAIQLSTIHKSKGREFANIIVVMRTSAEARQGIGDDTGPAKGEDRSKDEAEPRVLFVALTRAKQTLHRMEARAKGVWMPNERWIRSFSGKGNFRKLSSLQVGLPGDVDPDSFATGPVGEVEERQQWLLENATTGTAVQLIHDRLEGGCPVYRIVIADRDVGSMASNFGWAVWHTLKRLNNIKPNKVPKRITGIWVKEVTTAVGNLGSESIDPSLRTSGMWLTLTLEGLGNCQWYE